MPGFDRNRFRCLAVWLAKELECSICLEIFNKAVETQCGHTFCIDCIWKTRVNNTIVCPLCRYAMDQWESPRAATAVPVNSKGLIFKFSPIVNSIINKLKTNCDFKAKGCEEVLELGSLSAHLESCEYNLCAKCGLKVGKSSEHDCIELLKTKLMLSDNEWVMKCCQLEEEVKRLKMQMTENGIIELSKDSDENIDYMQLKHRELLKRFSSEEHPNVGKKSKK